MWRNLGIRIHVLTLASLPQGENACRAPAQVYVDTITVTDSRWRTPRALGIGDTVSRLRALYPKAIFAPAYGRKVWWLVTDIGYVPARTARPT